MPKKKKRLVTNDSRDLYTTQCIDTQYSYFCLFHFFFDFENLIEPARDWFASFTAHQYFIQTKLSTQIFRNWHVKYCKTYARWNIPLAEIHLICNDLSFWCMLNKWWFFFCFYSPVLAFFFFNFFFFISILVVPIIINYPN